MTPTNAVFRRLFMVCMNHGDTYDYVPDSSERYPFIWIDSERQERTPNTELNGVTTQTVRIYGLLTDRNKIDSIATSIHDELLTVKDAFSYAINLESCEITPIKENADGTRLLHYVLDMDFRYNKKER